MQPRVKRILNFLLLNQLVTSKIYMDPLKEISTHPTSFPYYLASLQSTTMQLLTEISNTQTKFTVKMHVDNLEYQLHPPDKIVGHG